MPAKNHQFSGDILGTAAAAALLGYTPDYMKRLVLRGKIPAVKIGKTWLFKRADVLAYKPAPVGKPKGKKKGRIP